MADEPIEDLETTIANLDSMIGLLDIKLAELQERFRRADLDEARKLVQHDLRSLCQQLQKQVS